MTLFGYFASLLRFRGYLKARRNLVAPQGIVVVLRNGDRIPVECAYDGIGHDGTFEWKVTTPIPGNQFEAMEIKYLPAYTTVVVEGPVYETEDPDA